MTTASFVLVRVVLSTPPLFVEKGYTYECSHLNSSWETFASLIWIIRMKQGSVSLLEMCISSTVMCKLGVQKSKNIDFSGYCYNAFFISN